MDIPAKQRAYVMTKERGLVYRDDMPVPQEIPQGYILLKIMGASICGTDIGILKGYKDPWTSENVFPNMREDSPLILGHELYGKVVAAGKKSKIKLGMVGASESHYPCPDCLKKGLEGWQCKHYGIIGVWGCRQKDGTRAPSIGGAYAEYIMIPEINFIELGALANDFHGSLVEPCGNAWLIMEDLAKRGLPESMLIFGSGPHGLNLQAFASYFGVKNIVVIEPSDFRRGFARSMGAANFVIKNGDHLNLGEHNHGRPFDVVVDMVGVRAVVDMVMERNLIKKDGIFGLFGLPKEPERVIEIEKGKFDMSRFIFERRESYARTRSGSRFRFIGYTGRTGEGLRAMIKALKDGNRGKVLASMLNRQMRIAGPLNKLKDMIASGFPYNMSPDDLKIGFTAFER